MFREKSLIVVSVLLIILLAAALAPVSAVFAQGPVDVCLNSTPRIAVISAFNAEFELLLSEAEIEGICVIGNVSYHIGTLRGNDVVMFLSGVSMVNATMTTERAINYFNVERIVFSGIAGGVNPDLHIGDVVVPIQYGEYLESYFAREVNGVFTPPPYWTPEFPNYGMIFPSSVGVIDLAAEPDSYLDQFWFPADAEMFAVAQRLIVDLEQCTPEQVCLTQAPVLVVGGNGVSGQSFVDNAEFRTYVWDTFGANVLEMETAAVAHVAQSHAIPYLAFRSLSDLAGGGPGENEIRTFFQLAADNSARVLLTFLEEWAKTH
ncbi:MAG: 5'-methylthioadenosine/S-adenosylhomocysteine nucleosidase [Anaerolineae bacterium]|nr:5'-methylthioadenosine/S-adenosylhomocysteine nucleosidase [Anaerolineae bacterium]